MTAALFLFAACWLTIGLVLFAVLVLLERKCGGNWWNQPRANKALSVVMIALLWPVVLLLAAMVAVDVWNERNRK